MLIKSLIVSIALLAHMWLWGQWSLEKSIGQTLMMIGASLILMVILVLPVRSFVRKQGFLIFLKKRWFRFLIYLYVLLILFLSAVSFTGLMQYLLPIKVFLIATASFLQYKFWRKKKA